MMIYTIHEMHIFKYECENHQHITKQIVGNKCITRVELFSYLYDLTYLVI